MDNFQYLPSLELHSKILDFNHSSASATLHGGGGAAEEINFYYSLTYDLYSANQ